MSLPILFLIAGALLSLITSAGVSLLSGWQTRRFFIFTGVIFILGWATTHEIYRRSAKEAFADTSPDGLYKVVVYRLPNFSITPGSGSDAPAIARLFDASGHLLGEVDVPMIQMAEVDWYPGSVSIASSLLQLK